MTTKRIVELVKTYLKSRTPSGYSLVIPDDGVLHVTDGISKQHERWYVLVKPVPESIADTRHNEYLEILADVEQVINKKHRITVYLTSMLPVI